MAENIEIPKTPMSRTEQYLTKIVKELSGSKEDVEIPKAALSRVEYYLQAIVNLLAEVALGETFTADEKKKLASITNPINVKGTCTQEELDEKTETAQVGDMWFVKDNETGEDSKSKEYVFTKDGEFDLVGDNSINLDDYVKTTDIASQETAGLIQADDPKQSGLTIDADGKIAIYHPEANDITEENISESHTALTLDRVSAVMNYYGLEDKDTLKDDYVKQTQIATTPDNSTDGAVRTGLVNLGEPFENGLTTESGAPNSHILKLTLCDEDHIKNETNIRVALHPNNIPMFMKNYGLESKDYLANTYQRKDEHASTTRYGNIMMDKAAGGLILSGEGKLRLADVTDDEIKEETSGARKALVPKSIPIFMNNYGITNKGWCHEIKKMTRNNATTDSDGIVSQTNIGIVIAAYASSKVPDTDRSVCLIPIYGYTGTYTSFIAIDYRTREPIASQNIGDVTYYYITPIKDTTAVEQTKSSSSESEEPSFETGEFSPQSDKVTESVLEPSTEPQSQHVPFHTEVETTEVVDPIETEDIQDGEIDG